MSETLPSANYMQDIGILFAVLKDAPIARTLTLGHWRNIDLATDGTVISAEFINVPYEGIDLRGVPEADTIARLISERYGSDPVIQQALARGAAAEPVS